MLGFAAAFLLCLLLYLLAIAAAGWVAGITIREFSYGVGPCLLKVGLFRLRAFPLGGYVQFKRSSDGLESAEEMSTALDGKSTAWQVFVSLAGCLVLLALAVVILGGGAIQVAMAGARDFLLGGVSPAGEAQVLLRSARDFCASTPFPLLLGVVAAKVAGYNLLPFPQMNGGAVIAVFARKIGLSRCWPSAATIVLVLAGVAMWASWAYALFWFVINH